MIGASVMNPLDNAEPAYAALGKMKGYIGPPNAN